MDSRLYYSDHITPHRDPSSTPRSLLPRSWEQSQNPQLYGNFTHYVYEQQRHRTHQLHASPHPLIVLPPSNQLTGQSLPQSIRVANYPTGAQVSHSGRKGVPYPMSSYTSNLDDRLSGRISLPNHEREEPGFQSNCGRADPIWLREGIRPELPRDAQLTDWSGRLCYPVDKRICEKEYYEEGFNKDYNWTPAEVLRRNRSTLRIPGRGDANDREEYWVPSSCTVRGKIAANVKIDEPLKSNFLSRLAGSSMSDSPSYTLLQNSRKRKMAVHGSLVQKKLRRKIDDKHLKKGNCLPSPTGAHGPSNGERHSTSTRGTRSMVVGRSFGCLNEGPTFEECGKIVSSSIGEAAEGNNTKIRTSIGNQKKILCHIPLSKVVLSQNETRWKEGSSYLASSPLKPRDYGVTKSVAGTDVSRNVKAKASSKDSKTKHVGSDVVACSSSSKEGKNLLHLSPVPQRLEEKTVSMCSRDGDSLSDVALLPVTETKPSEFPTANAKSKYLGKKHSIGENSKPRNSSVGIPAQSSVQGRLDKIDVQYESPVHLGNQCDEVKISDRNDLVVQGADNAVSATNYKVFEHSRSTEDSLNNVKESEAFHFRGSNKISYSEPDVISAKSCTNHVKSTGERVSLDQSCVKSSPTKNPLESICYSSSGKNVVDVSKIQDNVNDDDGLHWTRISFNVSNLGNDAVERPKMSEDLSFVDNNLPHSNEKHCEERVLNVPLNSSDDLHETLAQNSRSTDSSPIQDMAEHKSNLSLASNVNVSYPASASLPYSMKTDFLMLKLEISTPDKLPLPSEGDMSDDFLCTSAHGLNGSPKGDKEVRSVLSFPNVLGHFGSTNPNIIDLTPVIQPTFRTDVTDCEIVEKVNEDVNYAGEKSSKNNQSISCKLNENLGSSEEFYKCDTKAISPSTDSDFSVDTNLRYISTCGDNVESGHNPCSDTALGRTNLEMNYGDDDIDISAPERITAICDSSSQNLVNLHNFSESKGSLCGKDDSEQGPVFSTLTSSVNDTDKVLPDQNREPRKLLQKSGKWHSISSTSRKPPPTYFPKSRTWHLNANPSPVIAEGLQSLFSRNIKPKAPSSCYVRKGNSLVRKSTPSITQSSTSLGSNQSKQLVSSRFEESKKNASSSFPMVRKNQHLPNAIETESGNNDKSASLEDISVAQEFPTTKRERCNEQIDGDMVISTTKTVLTNNHKPNQLEGFDSVAADFGSYYKRRKNQLIRTSLSNQRRQDSLDDVNLNQEKLATPSLRAKTKSKKLPRKVSRKSFKPSNYSLVWTLKGSHVPTYPSGKYLPQLFPWKWATYRRKSLISRQGVLLTSTNTIYRKSKCGFSLQKVKWFNGSTSNCSNSIEKTSVENVNKKPKGVRLKRNVPVKRIFQIGSLCYKMDSAKRTLQRISNDPSVSGSLQLEKEVKTPYIPKRLVIGKHEYVRIGNGNQLIRDPKRRARVLANEKVRWSLHTVRSRLCKKKKYCQFFTRFGKCNKSDGKCPYMHDHSKIAVCTKFLNGLCTRSDCKLTHKVIPERMPDCSYYLEGLCNNGNCPYRHIYVDPNASICPGFLKGFCADGDECRKKHSYECPIYKDKGSCSLGSKCKLLHPKPQKKTMKNKRPRDMDSRTRYFGNMQVKGNDTVTYNSGKDYTLHCYDGFDGDMPDFISIESTDEECASE